MKKDYYTFTEYNFSLGEYFYILKNGNVLASTLIREGINKIALLSDNKALAKYDLSREKSLDCNTIKELPDYGNYNFTHTFIDSPLDLNELKSLSIDEWAEDPFYKNGLLRFFNEKS